MHGFTNRVVSLTLAFDGDDNPAIAYITDDDLRFARWSGAGWEIEVLDWGAWLWGFSGPSLAFDASGQPAISYVHCARDLRLATTLVDVTLHRGSVASLSSGWRTSALPLTSANDDETPPFPIPATIPGLEQDPLTTSDPLVLYRILGPGDVPAGNSLRVMKRPGAAAIGF